MSVDSLVSVYVESMKKAQTDYIDAIEKAQNLIRFNIPKAIEMDEILGKCEENTDHLDSSDIPVSTDNRPHHECPILPCKSSAFKIKRHLRKHKLSDKQIKYALNCCKLFVSNFCMKRDPPLDFPLISKKYRYSTFKVNNRVQFTNREYKIWANSITNCILIWKLIFKANPWEWFGTLRRFKNKNMINNIVLSNIYLTIIF